MEESVFPEVTTIDLFCWCAFVVPALVTCMYLRHPGILEQFFVFQKCSCLIEALLHHARLEIQRQSHKRCLACLVLSNEAEPGSTQLNPEPPLIEPGSTSWLNILAQHPGTRLLGRGQLRKLLQKLVRWLARLQGMHVPLLQALANETLFLQLLEDRQSIVRECERMIVFAARDSHRITVSGRNWRGSKSVRPCPCLGTSIHQVMCMCRAGCFCSC